MERERRPFGKVRVGSADHNTEPWAVCDPRLLTRCRSAPEVHSGHMSTPAVYPPMCFHTSVDVIDARNAWMLGSADSASATLPPARAFPVLPEPRPARLRVSARRLSAGAVPGRRGLAWR